MSQSPASQRNHVRQSNSPLLFRSSNYQGMKPPIAGSHPRPVHLAQLLDVVVLDVATEYNNPTRCSLCIAKKPSHVEATYANEGKSKVQRSLCVPKKTSLCQGSLCRQRKKVPKKPSSAQSSLCSERKKTPIIHYPSIILPGVSCKTQTPKKKKQKK